jgi:hypothetical protein
MHIDVTRDLMATRASADLLRGSYLAICSSLMNSDIVLHLIGITPNFHLSLRLTELLYKHY